MVSPWYERTMGVSDDSGCTSFVVVLLTLHGAGRGDLNFKTNARSPGISLYCVVDGVFWRFGVRAKSLFYGPKGGYAHC